MAHKRPSIVVIAPNWLGDAVMALPLIGYLGAVGGTALRVVVSPYTSRVFFGLEPIDELIEMPRTGRTRGIGARASTLRKLETDGVVVLPPSFSGALGAFLSGARHRIGFAHDGRSALLSTALPGNGLRDEHLSENYLRLGRELVARLGLAPVDVFPRPAIRVYPSERAAIKGRLRESGVPGDAFVVVMPGAMYGPTKHWPADKYGALIEQLGRRIPVVIAGGENDRALGESIAADIPGVFNLAGATSMGELFALLEGARVVVANDSGAPHAAASIGTPVVVIFGSTSPVWTRPLGDNVRVIREPVACAPCFLRECPTQLECYAAITPDRVLAEVLDILGDAVETETPPGEVDRMNVKSAPIFRSAVKLQQHIESESPRSVVLASGCFDPLHVGHVRYLRDAKRAGDYLVVAIHDDRSTRRLKGDGRPIMPAGDRARLIAGLGMVDGVLIFGARDVVRIVDKLRPRYAAVGSPDAAPELPSAASTAVIVVGGPKEHESSEIVERVAAGQADQRAEPR